MTISLWRYSHLCLAIVSSVFLLMAALTGFILSFEPIWEQTEGPSIGNLNSITLAEAMANIGGQYDEVLSIEKDNNDFILVSAFGEDVSGKFYVDPFTGEKIGDIEPESKFFEFNKSLHRSLFLGTGGRLLVGIISFLLFLMAVSGVLLILRKQGGIRKFFSRVIKMSFWADYHTMLGRLTLIPIVIISLTGTYLSMVRFSVIPNPTVSISVDYDAINDGPRTDIKDFAAFTQYTLADLRSLEYPFSSDVEDPFYLKLKEKEMMLNQNTGEILAEAPYPFTLLSSELAFMLHTGQGTILWAIVLGLVSLAILFFIFSGFAVTLKRQKKKFSNPFSVSNCEYVILVGSEGGSTWQFANLLHSELLHQKKQSYLTDMNKFEHFKNMKYLLVVTATYGQGEAPSNATKFAKLFKAHSHTQQPFSFAVVGFGSLAYPDFCKFALDTDKVIGQHSNAKRLLNSFTINNQSFEAYSQWVNAVSEKINVPLELPKTPNFKLKKELSKFEVVDIIYSANLDDNTALIELAPQSKCKFKGGDLLAVYPEENGLERLYSIGTCHEGEHILISVKKHDQGLCSTLLHNLKPGDTLEASLLNNNSFHFPKKAKQIVMISNGTGIAPFLGMIGNRESNHDISLYWGGRTSQSLDIYQRFIDHAFAKGNLSRFNPVFSREDGKLYVQDLITKESEFIAEVFRTGGVFMICGSTTMQKGVIEVLDKICRNKTNNPLSHYQNNKQLLMDCY